jgi:uncharacterized membrane-anchored protein
MRPILDFVARIPRPVLFAVAALVQVALVSVMVFDRIQILRQGTEVKLHTRAVDPRDLLRGDYVTLNYDITLVASAEAKDLPREKIVFVELVPKTDGFYEAVAVHREPVSVAKPGVLIKGRVLGNFITPTISQVRVSYGIEKYFVPQGEGREIEQARNQGKVSVVSAVTPSGRAAIKRLLIDDKPVYDEPLF